MKNNVSDTLIQLEEKTRTSSAMNAAIGKKSGASFEVVMTDLVRIWEIKEPKMSEGHFIGTLRRSRN